eukprot:COSAG06_NODE_984_length_11197_cov_75.225806_4_plen_52_part_00
MEGRVILIPSVRKCLLTLSLTDVSSWILGAGLLVSRVSLSRCHSALPVECG